MGTWVELAAYYPPGKLTPATTLVVALGHLAGATSIYDGGGLAPFFPRRGIAADRDLLERAEHFIGQVPLDDFLAEARERLNPQQLHCLALNLLDSACAASAPPAAAARLDRLLAGLGITRAAAEQLGVVSALKDDLSIFPQ
jgi:hypothetical protein